MGLFIDEEKLKREGVNVYFTNSKTIKDRQISKYTTKYENITRFYGDETAEEYCKIGEYVHVEGEIPISYIEYIKFY